MPNFEMIEAKKNQLIRKALGGALIVGTFADTSEIATLTDAAGELQALPSGYIDGGLMTDEGIRFARAIENSDITSWGRTEPTRSDISSDVETAQVDFQETSKITISLFTGADPAGMVPDATTGELIIDKPKLPPKRYYRLLSLAVDLHEAGEIYVGKFMPRVEVTEFADQAYAKGDAAIQWGMTFAARVDETLGYSVRHFFAGPGWKAQLIDAGFPPPTGV